MCVCVYIHTHANFKEYNGQMHSPFAFYISSISAFSIPRELLKVEEPNLISL